jgi:hypothetical protein
LRIFIVFMSLKFIFELHFYALRGRFSVFTTSYDDVNSNFDLSLSLVNVYFEGVCHMGCEKVYAN